MQYENQLNQAISKKLAARLAAGLRNSLGQLLAQARGFPCRSGSLFGSTASDTPDKASLSASEMAMGLLTQQPSHRHKTTPTLSPRAGLFF